MYILYQYFIGLLIKRELCPNLAIRSKVDTDYEFSYLWFLVCLFHDMGYAIENDWTYKFTYKRIQINIEISIEKREIYLNGDKIDMKI